MCDYSLEHMQSRPAVVGDKLVTTFWPSSITRGFSAVGDPGVAVCLLPGTELAFDGNITYDHALGFFPTKTYEAKTAIFRHTNENMPYQHHDTLELPDGRAVLLTRLVPGQTATVLQLPATEKPVEVVEKPAAEEPAEVEDQPVPVTEPAD